MTTFVVLLLAYVLSQFFRAFLAVIAGDLTRDLGLDAAQLGSLPAAWLGAFAAAQFPIGYALDRLGPRRTLALFMTGIVAGCAWLAAAKSYGEALAALALIGAGCAPILMAGFYLAARLYSVRHFATMSSLLIGFGSIGDPLSGAPLAFLLGRFGWRPTMLGLAGVAALVTALVALLLRDPPPLAGERRPVSLLAGLREVAGNRALWPILPVVFTSYAATIAIRGLWIIPYLETVHGFGQGQASLAAMAMGTAMAAGALLYIPLQGPLGGPKPAVSVGVAASAAGCLALGLFGGAGPAVAVGLLVAIGFVGITYATLMAHARRFMSADGVGRGVTFMNFVFMGGAGATQWLSGRFVQAAQGAGLDPAATYGRLFVGFGIALGVSLATYAFAERHPEAGPT